MLFLAFAAPPSPNDFRQTHIIIFSPFLAPSLAAPFSSLFAFYEVNRSDEPSRRPTLTHPTRVHAPGTGTGTGTGRREFQLRQPGTAPAFRSSAPDGSALLGGRVRDGITADASDRPQHWHVSVTQSRRSSSAYRGDSGNSSIQILCSISSGALRCSLLPLQLLM